MTRIYLVEDDEVLQRLINQWIDKLPRMIMCGGASTGQQAFEEIVEVKPDLVIIR